MTGKAAPAPQRRPLRPAGGSHRAGLSSEKQDEASVRCLTGCAHCLDGMTSRHIGGPESARQYRRVSGTKPCAKHLQPCRGRSADDSACCNAAHYPGDPRRNTCQNTAHNGIAGYHHPMHALPYEQIRGVQRFVSGSRVAGTTDQTKADAPSCRLVTIDRFAVMALARAAMARGDYETGGKA